MKKIEIVTILDNPNFGTYLQAFALGVILKKLGFEIELLYYLRPKWHGTSIKKQLLSRFDFIFWLCAIICNNKVMLQIHGCRSFIRKELKLTRPYYSYKQILKHPPVADIYLTGSDQVWNTLHNGGIDKTYYLGFVPDDKPKYAYGASIGMSTIPDEFKEDTFKLLNRYLAISVREKSNIELLKSIGLKSEMVLDPTFLLGAEDWKKYIDVPKEKVNYILVYSVESNIQNNLINRIAKYLSHKTGMKVIEVSYGNKSIEDCNDYYLYSTPEVFLNLVANASFIVGSSFHLTAFSINFNKRFITVAPERFSSRVDSLLELVGLEDRKVDKYDESIVDSIYNSPIDFEKISDILNNHRNSSFEYINKNIVLT